MLKPLGLGFLFLTTVLVCMGGKGLVVGPLSLEHPRNPSFICGLCGLLYALGRRKWVTVPALPLALGYLAWCLFTDLFRGKDTAEALEYTLTNHVFLMTFLAGVPQILSRAKTLRWNVYIFLAVATIIGLYCTYEHWQYGLGEYFMRHTFWRTKGRLGGFFLTTFCSCLGLLIAYWRKPRLLILLGILGLFALFGLLYSYDRTSYVGLVASCGLVFLLFFKRGWLPMLTLLILVILLALLGTRNYISNNLYEVDIPRRIRSIFDLKDATLRHRFLVWQGSAKMVARHPFIGVGEVQFFDTYRELKPPEETESDRHNAFHAHNILLHAAATRGLPGAVLLSVILVVYLRWLWGPGTSKKSPLALGLGLGALASLGGIVMDGMGDVPKFTNVLTVVLQLAWASSAYHLGNNLPYGRNGEVEKLDSST